jgi:hypothetical protein
VIGLSGEVFKEKVILKSKSRHLKGINLSFFLRNKEVFGRYVLWSVESGLVSSGILNSLFWVWNGWLIVFVYIFIYIRILVFLPLHVAALGIKLRFCGSLRDSDFRWRIMYSFSIHPDPYLEIYVPPQRLIDEHLSPQAMHLKPSKASFSHH